MATWLNRVAIAAPRNGSNAHTVAPDGTGGTVVSGTAFTPTSGRLLVLVVEGAVTSTTPSGWTLPSGGSAINETGLYVWHRTAASGANSITTTHNGSNYPVVFEWFEFEAGSTFLGSAAATNVNPATAAPTLTTAAGTKTYISAAAQAVANSTTRTWTWGTGTELTDTCVVASGTDGYAYSTASVEDSTATSLSMQAASTVGTPMLERLLWAVNVATDGGAITGTLSASTPTVTVGVPTSSIVGTVTVPVYTGGLTASSPGVTVSVPLASITGTSAVPAYTGTLDATAPPLTVNVALATISGNATVPEGTGELSASLPEIIVSVPDIAWDGEVTVPLFSGDLISDLPTVSIAVPLAAISGEASVPVYTGEIAASVPVITVSVPTSVIEGSVTPPSGATLVASLPGITVHVPVSSISGSVELPPSYTGDLAATLPTITVSVPIAVITGTVSDTGVRDITIRFSAFKRPTLYLNGPHGAQLSMGIPRRPEWHFTPKAENI